jgi:hypothetical protein
MNISELESDMASMESGIHILTRRVVRNSGSTEGLA